MLNAADDSTASAAESCSSNSNNKQRPSCFNGPTLNGGDQSAVSSHELSRLEEGQLAADQQQYGPLNRDEATTAEAMGTAAIPLPSSSGQQQLMIMDKPSNSGMMETGTSSGSGGTNQFISSIIGFHYQTPTTTTIANEDHQFHQQQQEQEGGGGQKEENEEDAKDDVDDDDDDSDVNVVDDDDADEIRHQLLQVLNNRTFLSAYAEDVRRFAATMDRGMLDLIASTMNPTTITSLNNASPTTTATEEKTQEDEKEGNSGKENKKSSNKRNNKEYHDENDHRYVGLVNQAMTCYLNSLIQTLYMTPEFRAAIYKWSSCKQAEEANNIPYQLQKLFLLLQTSQKPSLETKELTASFGWESNEAYDQHDVQELCRIMFDALEHRWRKTENRSLIQDLYKGTMEDYVKCLRCGTENAKKDVFLDLPLPIKQFGAQQSYKSIEEALSEFVKPEVLSGGNQYQCDVCNSKEDAEKGLRITEFPYLLTIQLKRFDFDYQTLHRIKLNDRITFPDYLELNQFVYAPPEPPAPKISYAAAAKKHKPEPKAGCSKNADESPPEDPFTSPSTSTSSENKKPAEKRQWLNVPANADEIQQMLKHGRYVYELFSIMVHQGSATAGHYFAYIKNMDQNLWFCFNDSSVQAASLQDIYRTFGSSSGYGYMNNMNAYMLMYRLVDPARNVHFVRTLDLSQYLKDMRERLELEEQQREAQQKYESELVKIHFICNEERCMGRDTEGAHPYTLLMHKDVSLESVFGELLSKLEEFDNESWMMQMGMPPERIQYEHRRQNSTRLVRCTNNWEMEDVVVQYPMQMDNAMVDMEICAGDEGVYTIGGEDEFVEKRQRLLDSLVYSYFRRDVYLMVDTKPSEELPFYVISSPDERSFAKRTYEVWLVDYVRDQVRFTKRVCLDLDCNVRDLKRLLYDVVPAVRDTEQDCLQWAADLLKNLRAKKAAKVQKGLEQEAEEEENAAIAAIGGAGDQQAVATAKSLETEEEEKKEEGKMQEKKMAEEGGEGASAAAGKAEIDDDEQKQQKSDEGVDDKVKSDNTTTAADDNNGTDNKNTEDDTFQSFNPLWGYSRVQVDSEEDEPEEQKKQPPQQKSAETIADERKQKLEEPDKQQQHEKPPEEAVVGEEEVPDDNEKKKREMPEKKGEPKEEAKDGGDSEEQELLRVLEQKIPLCILLFDRNINSSSRNYHRGGGGNYGIEDSDDQRLMDKWLHELCFAYVNKKDGTKLGDVWMGGNNGYRIFVSVGPSQQIIDDYKQEFKRFRQLIEMFKFSHRIHMLLPFKDQIALLRQRHQELAVLEQQKQQQQQGTSSSTTTAVEHFSFLGNAKTGGADGGQPKDVEMVTPKSANEKCPQQQQIHPPAMTSTAAQTTAQEEKQRPVAIVAPTVVQQQSTTVKDKFNLDLDAVFETDHAAAPSPVVQEPVPTSFLASQSSAASKSRPEGYSLADPTPPPPYFINDYVYPYSNNDDDNNLPPLSLSPPPYVNINFIPPPPGFDPHPQLAESLERQQQNVPMKSDSMVCHHPSEEDVVMGGDQDEEEEQSGDEGEQQQLLLPGDDVDDPMMGMSSCPSTPKISPVVSEASGDESIQESMENPLLLGGELRRWDEEPGAIRFMDNRRKREKQRVNMDRVNMLYSQRDNFRDASSTVAATATTTTEMATTTTELGSRGDADDGISAVGAPTSTGAAAQLQQFMEDPDYGAGSDTLVGGTESTVGSTATASLAGGGAGDQQNGSGGSVNNEAASATMEEGDEAPPPLAPEEPTLQEKLAQRGWIRLLHENEGDGAQIPPSVIVQIDKRCPAHYLRKWLCAHLQLEEDQVRVNKHYSDTDDGFQFNPGPEESFETTLISHAHHFSVKLVMPPNAQPSPSKALTTDEKRGDEKENSQGGGGGRAGGTTGSSIGTRRRERPLRIKIMSQSESDDQPGRSAGGSDGGGQ